MQQQLGSLVGGCAAGESDGEDIRVKGDFCIVGNMLDQAFLCAGVCLPDFFAWNAQRVSEAEIVPPPAGDMPIKQLFELVLRSSREYPGVAKLERLAQGEAEDASRQIQNIDTLVDIKEVTFNVVRTETTNNA